MANETYSPNMNLPIPGVGLTFGPQWATDVNNCLSLIDIHDHSPGYGVQITPSGLDISSDLSFQNNDAVNLRSVQWTAQPTPLTDNASMYVSGVDLYFTDGTGNVIRITQSGSISGVSGTIAGLTSPASATYIPGDATFVWQSNANTPANMDAASYILRNLVANSKGLTLQPPAAMAADYSLVLPSLPATVKIMTLDASGNMSAVLYIDNATIVRNTNTLSVNASALNIPTAHQFDANGPYRVGTFVDGLMFFKANATITNIWIFNLKAGTSGTTEFDLKLASPGGSYSSILTTTGKITSAAAANIWTDSGAVVAPQTGVTKPVLTSSSVLAGQALRFDILTAMTAGANCGVIVEYVPA
jgi:hypothetical protein